MEEQRAVILPSALNQSNAVSSPHYAGLLIRCVASIIDGVIMLILAIIPIFIIVYISVSIASTNQSLLYPAAILIGLTALAITWAYEAGFESSKYMATPGKMVCGLKVTDLEGRQITLGTATIRFVFKSAISSLLQNFINNCLAFIYLLADVLFMYTSDQRQCLHDKVAGTLVVHNV